MNKTKIEWVKNPDGTQGYTWNPITGCLNGCSYCYARKLANGRLKPLYLANTNITTADINIATHPLDVVRRANDPFYPRFWEDRVFDDRGLFGNLGTKPKGIFACDMGELFGDWIPAGWQDHIFNFIKLNPIHRYYLLTKQPQNLTKFSPFPDNCWVGVTAITNALLLLAIGQLEKIEAKVKFLSLEPLLYELDGFKFAINSSIDWVIIGAQTKPYKPPKIEWVQEIVQACDKAGIPVFLKDNLMPILPENTIFSPFHFGIHGIRQEMPEGR